MWKVPHLDGHAGAVKALSKIGQGAHRHGGRPRQTPAAGREGRAQVLACLAIDAGKRALQVQASSWRVQDVDLPTTADAAITIHRPLKSAWPDSHRLKIIVQQCVL